MERQRFGCARPNWRRKTINELSTPGRFGNGGDRKSVAYRGRQQQAILEHVHQQVEASPEDMKTDDIAAICVNSIGARWRPTTPNGVIIIHRVVQTMVQRFRGESVSDDGNEVNRSFENIVIEDVVVEPECFRSPPKTHWEQPSPSLSTANVTLNDLKSVDGTLLTQWVGLQKEMLITQRAIEKRKETEAECATRQREAESVKEQKIAESLKEQKIAESVKEQTIAECATRQKEAECATRQKEIDLDITKEVTRQKEIESGRRVNLQSTQQKRKRDSETEYNEEWLNKEFRNAWRRMRSLSACVWDHRPDHHPESLSEFLARFDRWAKVGNNLRDTRHRIRYIAEGPGVCVVYCNLSIRILLCHPPYKDSVTVEWTTSSTTSGVTAPPLSIHNHSYQAV
jgi:hypothetical protein